MHKRKATRARRPGRKIRYAVVGLGHIAQKAVLPAFANATSNSELTAFVSSDARKIEVLGRRYGVDQAYSYDQYEECLEAGDIDAVYIALPNSMHAEFAIEAARRGIHVLCEKPMAVTSRDCSAMIGAARHHDVKLMIAYRLHFDPTTLETRKIARSGKLGELRYFTSSFSMQARPNNIRLDADLGGGPLYDIGIYCINAARMVFDDEPTAVQALHATSSDRRFREVEEATSVTMLFPGDRCAQFIASFGAADSSTYDVVGTKGKIRVEPAYDYAEGLAMEIKIGKKTKRRSFAKHDQFGPEILYFSDCILKDREPEPSGFEGRNDVCIIEAIHESARSGRRIALDLAPDRRPRPEQRMVRRGIREPRSIDVESGSL